MTATHRHRPLLAAALAGLFLGAAAADEPKKEPARKSGTVVGKLTAKGPNWIEVLADGEEKARRYVPHWVGGMPADGGGPDKKMLKVIGGLKLGSRLRVEWEFEERARVVKVEVLKRPAGKAAPDDEKDAEKKGAATGTLTAKGDKWVEVKADGEEKARRYFLHFGGTKDLLRAIRDTEVGSRVRVEWLFAERFRVLKLEPLKKKQQE
jgi:hypothetical protein